MTGFSWPALGVNGTYQAFVSWACLDLDFMISLRGVCRTPGFVLCCCHSLLIPGGVCRLLLAPARLLARRLDVVPSALGLSLLYPPRVGLLPRHQLQLSQWAMTTG